VIKLLFSLSYSTLHCCVAEIGNYHYGQGHPMKPHRVRMTHNLVVNYGLYREMEVFRPKPVSRDQMTRFHSDDYINFLRVINPDNMSEFLRHLQRCKATSSKIYFVGMVFSVYLHNFDFYF